MKNLDVLKMILAVDELRKHGERYETVEPYSVDEFGNVVDQPGDVLYEADGLAPGDAEIIVTLYNSLGFIEFRHMETFIELVNPKHESEGGNG